MHVYMHVYIEERSFIRHTHVDTHRHTEQKDLFDGFN